MTAPPTAIGETTHQHPPDESEAPTMTDDTYTAEQALTRHFGLVVDNDETLALERDAIVLRHLDREGDSYPHILGDALKDWAEGIAGLGDDKLTDLGREILTTGLAFVDWRSLAIDYIADHRERTAAVHSEGSDRYRERDCFDNRS